MAITPPTVTLTPTDNDTIYSKTMVEDAIEGAFNDLIAQLGDLAEADTVDNAMMADMAAARIKGRAVGAGSGDPQDLTPGEARAAIGATATGEALLMASSAAAARTALGLTIGTDVQAYDVELAALAGLTSAADRVPYFTGAGTAALATLTAAGRNLLDDADAAAQRTTLGLGALATINTVGTAQVDNDAITTDKIADAELKALAGVSSAADTLPYFTGAGAAAVTALTAEARAGVLTVVGPINLDTLRTDVGRLAAADGVDALDRAVEGFALGVQDSTGAVVGFTDEGALVAESVALYPGDDIDDWAEVTVLIAGASDAPLLAAKPDGSLDFIPSPELIDRIGVVAYLPPTDFGGSRTNIFNVRRALTDGLNYATARQPDGYVADLVQINGRQTALPVSSAPLPVILGTGQSNRGDVQRDAGPDILGSVYPDFVVTLDVGGFARGTDILSAASPTDFVSWSEPVSISRNKPSPDGLSGYAMGRLLTHFGLTNPGVVRAVCYEGGQPLLSWEAGTPGLYLAENLIAQASAAGRIAGDYGRDVALWVSMTQGEAGSHTLWESQFDALIADEFEDARLAAGATTLGIMATQVNASQTANEPGSGLQILSWARNNLAANRILVGPQYHGPLNDTIHLDNVGTAICAQDEALAFVAAHFLGLEWHPLWPTAGGVTRSGAVIRIPLERPPIPGCTGPRFDTDWVATIANRGFRYTDDSGSPPAISSVAIDGDEIVITLAATPTGSNRRIRYACDNLTETVGWAGPRGQVYADTRIPSPLYPNVDIPPTIRAYLIRFEETVP